MRYLRARTAIFPLTVGIQKDIPLLFMENRIEV